MKDNNKTKENNSSRKSTQLDSNQTSNQNIIENASQINPLDNDVNKQQKSDKINPEETENDNIKNMQNFNIEEESGLYNVHDKKIKNNDSNCFINPNNKGNTSQENSLDNVNKQQKSDKIEKNININNNNFVIFEGKSNINIIFYNNTKNNENNKFDKINNNEIIFIRNKRIKKKKGCHLNLKSNYKSINLRKQKSLLI